MRMTAGRPTVLSLFGPVLVCSILAGIAFRSGSTAVEQPVPADAYDPDTVRFHKNGVISKCKLLKWMEIQGYPCCRWVRFFPDGRVARFQAQRDIVISGVSVPAKSDIFLDENGVFYKGWFDGELDIDGIPVDGGCGKLETTFYRDGTIKSCFLYKTAEIDGVPCKASVFHPVEFFENGRLKRCTLARSVTRNGRVYKKGELIVIDETGRDAEESE